MKIVRGLLAAFIMLPVLGCFHQDADAPDSLQTDLDKNTTLWNGSGISDYQYTYKRIYFCVPEEDIVIVVKSGVISEAFYTPSGMFVSDTQLLNLHTISGLFDVIQAAINSNAASLSVTYNSLHGYPEKIAIDQDTNSVDEEITHIVTDFQETNKELEIVYINDGAIQCESQGMSELETAQTLIDNGIDVLRSQCGFQSDIAVVAVCGAGDVNINLHTINSQNLSDAQALGFESVSTLKNDVDRGYVLIDCPQ